MWFNDRSLERFTGLSPNEVREIESLVICLVRESDPDDRRRLKSIREVDSHDLIFEE